MSKIQLKKALQRNRVMAIPTRNVKNSKGEIVKQFYNLVRMG